MEDKGRLFCDKCGAWTEHIVSTDGRGVCVREHTQLVFRRIKAILALKKMTRSDLFSVASRQTLDGWSSGRHLPSPEALGAVAVVLEVPVSVLTSDDGWPVKTD